MLLTTQIAGYCHKLAFIFSLISEGSKLRYNFYHSRYHPHLLLAKSRFLFPLTSKRLTIIKDLLRMSETDSLHPCFVARIDRRVPLKERHKYPPSNTVFMQTYNTLKNKELNFRYVIIFILHVDGILLGGVTYKSFHKEKKRNRNKESIGTFVVKWEQRVHLYLCSKKGRKVHWNICSKIGTNVHWYICSKI